MINRSPWLWGVRKTAAGLTGRTSRGQQILQGKRAKGQSNPSPSYLQAQQVAFYVSKWYHSMAFLLNQGFTNIPTGSTVYAEFMRRAYATAFNLSSPPVANVDATGIQTSFGVMTATPVTGTTTAVASTGIVTIHWNPDPVDDSQLDTDHMLVSIFNVATGAFIFSAEVTDRSAGTYVAHAPIGSFSAAQLIGIYLGARGLDGSLNANTSSPSYAMTFTTT